MEKEEFDSYVKAGGIAKEVKIFARELVKPGMKLIDIANAIDEKILELGGEFAFPVNLSLNEAAAHFTPADGDETKAEGILKIDIGVAINGFIADTAISIDLTEEGEFRDMIELNERILERASEVVRVGMEVRDVGEACQSVLEEFGDNRFAIIKSLSGHALAQDEIHAGLTISNYRNDNSTKLEDDAFAIEPFVTSGVGDIFEGKGGGIYVLKNGSQVRDRDSRKVLEFIHEEYGACPFCERWLLRGIRDSELEISVGKLRFILNNLVKQGILYEYPILIEKSRMPVSQVENTFVVANGKVICTTG
jgi:methionyl aminopeptidase